jgi:hypothetical protein
MTKILAIEDPQTRIDNLDESNQFIIKEIARSD